jgi:hypothetical protein
MVPRFTVIQGGLTDEPICAAKFGARQAMNCASGPRVAITLAWDRDGETGQKAVHSLMPLAMVHPLKGGRGRPSQLDEPKATALVEQAAAEAVDRALRERLGALPRPNRSAEAIRPVLKRPRMRRSAAAARSRAIPAANLIGIRPAQWEASGSETRPITEAPAERSTLARIVTRDAHTARRSATAAPVTASLVRLARALFECDGALRVACQRGTDRIIAGSHYLGIGAALMPWRRARA